MQPIKSSGYSVFFEEDDFHQLALFLQQHSFSKLFILCDTNTRKHCLPLLIKHNPSFKNAPVFSFPAGEKHKSLDTAHACWNFLLKHQADKNALLVNLGGGVVCDLGGFAAATYKRGIACINIPTTLLAMADASVGGKNGIDFMGYKNLIGTITQPRGVFIFQHFIRTLPIRQIQNGFAEIIKAALIGNKKLWDKISAPRPKPQASFIYPAVQVKNRMVRKDPYEKNIRQALNFGHSVGHAIEAYYLNSPKKYLLHGEAIAIGICVELMLGRALKLSKQKTVSNALAYIKQHYPLPTFTAQEISACMQLMQHDKKNKAGKLTFALIEKVGKPLINIQATAAQVKEAFALYNAFAVAPKAHKL